MTAHIGIVITSVADRAHYLDACIESLSEERQRGTDLSLVVIDNGGPTPLHEVLASQPEWLSIIRNDAPRALAATHNEGAAFLRDKGRCRFLLIMNDDTRLSPGSLETLVHVSEQHKNALLTPIQTSYDPPYVIDEHLMKSVADWKALVDDAVLGRDVQDAYPIEMFIGAAVFGPAEVFETIGPFDELFPFYGIDEDYGSRAKHHGVSLFLVPGAHLHHVHGLVQDRPERDYDAWLFRWRTHHQGRMLLILKDPSRGLARNYCRILMHTAGLIGFCLMRGWLRGASAMLVNLISLLRHAPDVGRHRREHYRDDVPSAKKRY